MATSRTNRLQSANGGTRQRDAHLPGERRRRRPTEVFAAVSRARRAAAEIADGMLEAFGTETAEHSRAVERIAVQIADRVGLSGRERRRVAIAARLHDVGKVAIPRSVLEKPKALTKKEWKLIYDHTVVGERILETVEELRDVAGLVRHSHERWDGAGYPDGLGGEEIPLESRIVFCADAFHGICSDRPYKSGRSTAEALAEMRDCSGTQFEPRIVDALTEAVRDDLYSGRPRVRPRSHSQIAVLLVLILSLGGSVGAGIAAPGSTPPPTGLQSASLANDGTLNPQLGVGLPFGTDPGASGGVAGAVAHSKPRDRAAGRHRAQTPDAPAGQVPSAAAPKTAPPPSGPRPRAPQPKPQAPPKRPLSFAQPSSLRQDVDQLADGANQAIRDLTAR